ncbi:unnamed protein product [Closterium sp. NIES-65]|nr:unnamed protein product [Closterium sp. NIES-65]
MDIPECGVPHDGLISEGLNRAPLRVLVGRVTVMKDKETRESKGVAFVLYVHKEDALKAVAVMQGKRLNGRMLQVSIASDNGRAAEFIRRKEYKDKSRCYECGDAGHLSYECPKNQGPKKHGGYFSDESGDEDD